MIQYDRSHTRVREYARCIQLRGGRKSCLERMPEGLAIEALRAGSKGARLPIRYKTRPGMI